MIITLSILDGFEHEIKSKVVEFTAHIQVTGFQNLPLGEHRSSLELVKKEVAGINAMAPFAAREGMIRSHDAVDGVLLKGIEPSTDAITPRYHLIEGTFFSEEGSVRQLVIGKKLALKLNATVGDKLVVFALPREQGGQPRAMQFILVGMYESGMAEFDDIYAYTKLTDAQALFQLGDDITGYDILVNDITQVDEIAKHVQQLLGYPHFARTVFQMYHNLFSWVELQKKLSPVLLSLIILVATINIIGTLLMFVLGKVGAIGILKSLGAAPGLIRRIFMLQGLSIAMVGIVCGNLLAYAFCYLQLKFKLVMIPSEIYYMNAVPVLLKMENFLLVTAIAFILCMLTTLLPSRAAAALNTVRALRFG